ncbi:tyrosine-type recombinase/integrase [Sorangium sp. So ce693]
MTGVPRRMASLLHGAGLHLLECAELRAKDVDLERRKILVRDGKGRKDRITMLPLRLVPLLRNHRTAVRAQHAADVAAGIRTYSEPDYIGEASRAFDYRRALQIEGSPLAVWE